LQQRRAGLTVGNKIEGQKEEVKMSKSTEFLLDFSMGSIPVLPANTIHSWENAIAPPYHKSKQPLSLIALNYNVQRFCGLFGRISRVDHLLAIGLIGG
jgi:hypothetical protein